MRRSEDFRLGARVLDRDGATAGTLVSVLVDEDGFDPKALVIKDETSLVGRLLAAEKVFVTDEVIVPISAVDSADHHVVRLSISRDQVRRENPYISYRFRPETAGEVLMKEAQLLGGGLAMPDVAEAANKPSGEIEIDRDENVMIRKTGHRLGKVHDLLYDDGELVGIVVRTDGLTGHDVVLPIRFVYRGDDMALFADLRQTDIAALKPFQEEPG
jgi:hypothetical protein